MGDRDLNNLTASDHRLAVSAVTVVEVTVVAVKRGKEIGLRERGEEEE